jgi:flagellum-specific peptidoglycan hydrolase FlgJ
MATKFTRQQFIGIIAPMCVKDMQRSGVFASLSIAQGILESADGNSGLATKGNNLFGIKAGSTWSGKYVEMPTKEFVNGNWITVNAKFRAYNNWEESIADHSSLLTKSSRYAKVITAKTYKEAAHEIWKAGYATDPNYPNLLIGLIEKNNLNKYDGNSGATVLPEAGYILFQYEGNVFKVEGKLVDNKNMVLVRPLLENLGFVVGWDGSKIIISKSSQV